MKIRMGVGVWNVTAIWFGTERVVYSHPDIFACFEWVLANEIGSE